MSSILQVTNTRTRTAQARITRRIKSWVERLGVLGADGVAHVAEVDCFEPGCPALATIISLLYSQAAENRTIKLFKPMASITQDELIHALLQSFADGPPAIAELKAALRGGGHHHRNG